MNTANSQVEHVNETLDHSPRDGDRGHSAAYGYVWLILGGMICALSVAGLGDELALREVVVYGVQGLLIALYGCHRLWLALPVSLRAASSPSRRDGLRSRLRHVTADCGTAPHRSRVGGAMAETL